MFNLIRNENMKIYRRVRTWILLGGMVAIVLLTGILIKTHERIDPNWKTTLTQQDVSMKQALTDPRSHIPAAAKPGMQETIQANEYRISHNIPPGSHTVWDFTQQVISRIGVLVAVVVAIIAGDSVASEFAGGTIKALLTRAVGRTQVLASKYLAMLLFGVFSLLVTLAASLLTGGILFGFHGYSAVYIYQNAQHVISQIAMGHWAFIEYGFQAVSILMTVTIAFMISTIFRSSALAIAISIVTLFVGNTLVFLLSQYGWVKYILFANTNLEQFFTGSPVVKGLTLPFSITMLAIYFVVMLALSWQVFSRRDVAA